MWHLLKRQSIKRILLFAGAGLLFTSLQSVVSQAAAQTTVPLLSGGIGFFTDTDGGNTTYLPTLAPVLAAPIGPKLLVESRATLLEAYFPKGSTPGYTSAPFLGFVFAQMDYLATSHVTAVGGYFLIPFGTYNERLSPIWIQNFQSAPIITPLGTMGSASGTGGELRGSAYSNHGMSIDYATYFSANSTNEQFVSERATGYRVDFYFPEKRLELGTSYGHQLGDGDPNYFGTHVWWEPAETFFKLRSEYAHGPHSQGYWVETDYRLGRYGGPESVLGRTEPVFRWQQAFRNSPGSDGLPSANTQRADFGLIYHLPHNVRIVTSYSRLFSSTGNRNIWQTGIVYRILLPTWKGK